MQALSGHPLAWRLKRYNWYTERDSEKRCERAAKRMSDDPYVCIGKHQGYVVIKVLKTQERASGPDSSADRLNLQLRLGKTGFPLQEHLQGSPDYISSRL